MKRKFNISQVKRGGNPSFVNFFYNPLSRNNKDFTKALHQTDRAKKGKEV